jgi:uncharacterized phage-associated protein
MMGKIILITEKHKEMVKMASIFDVAKYFLHKLLYEDESSITPLKLQKLCYYAQAWSLVWDNDKLFDEDFQAWAHGPANPDLYDMYRGYGSREIPIPNEIDLSVFTKEQMETMDIVWNEYGIYDGKYLERLTHQEDPWINSRSGYDPGERCCKVITKESIGDYFKSLNLQEN